MKSKLFIFPSRLFSLKQADMLYLVLLFLTAALLVFGLISVLSASSIVSYNNSGSFLSIFLTQCLAAAVGSGAVIILLFWKSFIDIIFRFSHIIFIFALSLQIITVLFGVSSGGNKNWISVFGFSLQPSEFLKLALIIYLAKKSHQYFGDFYDIRVFAKYLFLPFALACVAVAAGGDIGSLIIFCLIGFVCFLISGVPLRYLGILFILGCIGFICAILISSSRLKRLKVLFSGECDLYENLDSVCWQITQSKWAVATGKLFGIGIGESKAKWSWLPSSENDYIFAIIAEETGFIGATSLIILYTALAIVLYIITKKIMHNSFLCVVSSGIFIWIISQALLNILVVLGVLPAFGITLPFISAGGSSLIASLLSLGIIINIAKYKL